MNIIYAIQINKLSYGGLKILDVKIGMTINIKSTLLQYKRGNLEAEILNLWEANPSKTLRVCEKGMHMIAGKYAYKCSREKFIFLQNSYDDFAENASLLLKEVKSGDVGIKENGGRETEKIGYTRTGVTKEKPKSFMLRNNQYKVTSWTDLIVILCEQIYRENKEDFKKVLQHPSLKGKKRPYFSKNKYDLTKDNKRIKGTDIYIETRFNANHIVGLCKKILKLFNYKESDFKIELKNRNLINLNYSAK